MSEDSKKSKAVHYIAPDRDVLIRFNLDAIPVKGSYVQLELASYEVIEVWHSISQGDSEHQVVSVYLEPVDIASTYAGRHLRD